MSLTVLILMLLEFNPLGTTPNNGKATLHSWDRPDPQTSSEDCIIRLRKDLPRQILFDNDILHRPSIFYKHLRDYLNLIRFNYGKYSYKKFIMNSLTYSLFTDKADKTLGLHSLETKPLSLPNIIEDVLSEECEIERKKLIILHKDS